MKIRNFSCRDAHRMARACGGSLTLIFGLAVGAAEPVTDGPGDFKGNYDSPDYVTRSVSLEARVGRKANLLAIARHPPSACLRSRYRRTTP